MRRHRPVHKADDRLADRQRVSGPLALVGKAPL